MFCNKCGKQLPDNAVFCSGCGNQVGAAAPTAAPKAKAASSGELPLILKRLIGQVVGFFTKKDPVGVVTGSAHDKTWSGAILAGFGAIIMALAAMINVNQGLLSSIKDNYDVSTSQAKDLMKAYGLKFPSGVSFLMTLLTVVVLYAVVAAMVYVVTTKIAKKELSLPGALNIVAYASIPMICVSILNMLAGLIWFVLPVLFMLIAIVATLILISAGASSVCALEKPSFKVSMILYGVIAFVAFLMVWIALKSINDTDVTAISRIISLWIS